MRGWLVFGLAIFITWVCANIVMYLVLGTC